MPNEVIETLNEFQEIRPPSSQDMKRPEIWAKYGGVWSDVVPTLARDGEGDIYALLFRYANTFDETTPDKPEAVAIVTNGWGAPLDERGEVEGRPSEHPKRFRVSLTVAVLSSSLLASRLNFWGGEQKGETVDDEGLATGALAEAVDLLAWRIWGRDFTSALVYRWVDGKDTLPEEELRAIGARVSRFVDMFADMENEAEGVEA